MVHTSLASFSICVGEQCGYVFGGYIFVCGVLSEPDWLLDLHYWLLNMSICERFDSRVFESTTVEVHMHGLD